MREITGDSASVPVRVYYKAEDGNSLEVNTAAQFVRRGGIWYFANFDFMKWPWYLILIVGVALLVPISCATIGLVLWNRLAKRGALKGINVIKVFIPIFWPSLFRETPR